jgi:hypothetical protein
MRWEKPSTRHLLPAASIAMTAMPVRSDLALFPFEGSPNDDVDVDGARPGEPAGRPVPCPRGVLKHAPPMSA